MKAALSPSWSSFLEYSLEAISYNIHVIVKLYIAIIKWPMMFLMTNDITVKGELKHRFGL